MKLRVGGKIADLGADYSAAKPSCKQQCPAGTNDTSQCSICGSSCTHGGGNVLCKVQEIIGQERLEIQTKLKDFAYRDPPSTSPIPPKTD